MMTKLWTALFILLYSLPFFTVDAFADGDYGKQSVLGQQITWNFEQVIKGQGHDFSGITYVPEIDQYWIADDSCKLIQIEVLEDSLRHLNTVSLSGMQDCEAVSWIRSGESGHKIAVTQERRGQIAVFTVNSETKEIDCEQSCQIFTVPQMKPYIGKNSGIEAIASIDAEGEPVKFFVGKEEFPKEVYRVRWSESQWSSETLWNAEAALPLQGDISGMTIFEGKLFILDERMETIRQVKRLTGEIVRETKLPPLSWFQKYEGIILSRQEDGQIELVAVAEMNTVYVYRFLPKKI